MIHSHIVIIIAQVTVIQKSILYGEIYTIVTPIIILESGSSHERNYTRNIIYLAFAATRLSTS